MSQEGGAVISMDGVYFAMSQEGGAVSSLGGGYAEIVRNDFSELLTTY